MGRPPKRLTDDLVKVVGVRCMRVAQDHCGALWGRPVSGSGRLPADMMMMTNLSGALCHLEGTRETTWAGTSYFILSTSIF
jgi:hypothetical protein